jgi:hypothetical protein
MGSIIILFSKERKVIVLSIMGLLPISPKFGGGVKQTQRK